MQRALQLALLEEVRDPEPPIRLSALFYEPGTPEQVAAELRTLGDVVVGVGSGAHELAERLDLGMFQAEDGDSGARGRVHRTRRCSRPTRTACSGRSRAAGCRRSVTRTACSSGSTS